MFVLFKKIVTNVELRAYARGQGLSRSQTRQLVDACKDEHMRKAAAMCSTPIPEEFLQPTEMTATAVESEVVGEGGGFLKRLMDWLSSPQGQEFIKNLFAILIAILPMLI